jgi:hypothetical protein
MIVDDSDLTVLHLNLPFNEQISFSTLLQTLTEI